MEEAIQEKGLSVLPADKLLGRHPSLLTLNQIYGSAPYGWFYYVLFRLLKPSTVVETGVWYGVSTAFILQALEHNGNGTLYSIDLPNPNYVGRVENTGALVPNALRSRWSLILGKTQERLIPLLEKLGSIDAFICDSDHTYECMMFEFSTAWRFLTPGGVLISDDVHWNKAFTDFTRSQNLRPIIFQRKLFSTLFPSGERMGAILKPSTPRTHTV
jgi:predicted O-methyltransferase YrrM